VLRAVLQPLQLLREQAPGGGRETIGAVSDMAASMKTAKICRRTVCGWSAPARITPVMAPGRKTMPIVFLLSMTGAIVVSCTGLRMKLAVHCRGAAPRLGRRRPGRRASAERDRQLRAS